MAGSSGRLSHLYEHAIEFGDLRRRQMVHLAAVKVEHGNVEPLEQDQPLLRDVDEHDTAVGGRASPGRQARGFEAVDEARDVGRLRHHLRDDLLARQACAAVATEDPQHVVLRRRNAVLLEKRCRLTGKKVGGAEQVERGLLLGTVERLLFLQFGLEN